MRFRSVRELQQQMIRVKENWQFSKRRMLVMYGEGVKKDASEDLIGRIRPFQGVATPEGSFPPWAPLADATIERKEKAGLGKDGDPRSMLYGTGELAQSIQFKIVGSKCYVGTDVPYASVHEHGSTKVPARPFLGPASIRSMIKLRPKFEKILVRTIRGQSL